MRSDLLRISAVWAVILLAFLVVERFGVPVGFGVWPMGEDRNWIWFLQTGPGSQAARLFWQTDSRNPLSPWWYMAVRHIILRWDAGLLFVSHVTRLLLATTLYLCFRTILGPGGRQLSLSIGCLAAAMSFDGYIDNIIWNFSGAMALTFVSIAAYARFLDSDGSSRNFYALSLVAWFFAFATYTLQSGAILAIAFLGVSAPAGKVSGTAARVRARVIRAVSHLWPYVLIYLGFIMIWRTTIVPGVTLFDDVGFSFRSLLVSASMAIWHPDYLTFWGWIADLPSSSAAGLLAAIAVAAVTLPMVGSRAPADRFGVARTSALVRACVVALAVAAPTILLEGSSAGWAPGTRWRMLHPFWIPFVAAFLILAVHRTAQFLRSRREPATNADTWSSLPTGMVAAAIGIFFLVDLGHNAVQVAQTRREMAVRDAIGSLLSSTAANGHGDPLHVLVLPSSPDAWRASDWMSQRYVSTWFPGANVTLRVIPSREPQDVRWRAWWKVRFGPDGVGVGDVRVGGGSAPYRDVRILRLAASGRVSLMSHPDRQAFDGFDVSWERSGRLPVGVGSEPCGSNWNLVDPAGTKGFGALEKNTAGVFRWTIATSASIVVPACPGPATVSVRIAYTVTPGELPGVGLRLDGHRIDTVLQADAEGTLLTGRVSGAGVDGPSELEVTVPKLDRVPGDGRALGVAIRSITVEPDAAGPAR